MQKVTTGVENAQVIDKVDVSAIKDVRTLKVIQEAKPGIQFLQPSSNNRQPRSVLRMAMVIAGGGGAHVRKRNDGDTAAEAAGRFLINKVTGQYIQTCRNFGVDFNSTTSVISFLIANMKSIQHEVVHQAIFKAMEHEVPFVDWVWVRENIVKPNTNSLGDTSCWLTLLRSLHFSDEVELETERLVCFHTFRSLLRSVGFTDRDDIKIKDIIKLYLLLNIVGLTGYHAMERYLDEVLGGNIRTRCLQFTSKLGDQRYTTEDYDEAAIAILRCITVSPTFSSDVQVYVATKQELQMQMRQKEIEVYKGRPRLSSYLKEVNVDRLGGISVQNMHSLDIWLNFIRFPNTISRKTRQSVYLLMSIPSLNHSDWINRCLTKELATAVLSTPVTNPEIAALCTIITNIDYRSQAFHELAKFRNECLNNPADRREWGRDGAPAP